ncbi:MAG TPA: hypothetical protein VNH11_31565 [Pirellulales bacterium]|nr:hypothetical protein [Pirellulales bacterium]
MSTTATSTTQQLIDQRLDAIDRALLGLLPRNDRLTIVTQLETRLRELAAASPAVEAHQRSPVECATSADAAHFGAPAESALLPPGVAPLIPAGAKTLSARLKRSRLALSSGVLGIVALVALFVFPVSFAVISTFGERFEEAAMVLLGAHLATVAICGTLAVALGIAGLVVLNRRAGQLVGHGWAITGLCTGPLPMLAGSLIALVTGMQLLAVRTVQVTQVAAPGPPVYGYSSAAPVGDQAFPIGPVPQCAPMAPSFSAAGSIPQHEYVAGPPSAAPTSPLPADNPPAASAVPEAGPSADCPTDGTVPRVIPVQADEPVPAEAPVASQPATVR